MSTEIKEIIEALENTIKDDRIPYEIENYECKTLLDYITNLQEEIEGLKDFNIKLQGAKDRLDKYDRENQIRIDKAIEYIENNDELYYGDELYDGYQKIIDILKGETND